MEDTLVEQLCNELEMKEFVSFKKPSHYTLLFDGDITVSISREGSSHSFKSIIGQAPMSDTDSFFLRVMDANLFGSGTKGAAIGWNEEDNLLTLSLERDYNRSYKEFKSRLEDFVNVIEFWRQEALK